MLSCGQAHLDFVQRSSDSLKIGESFVPFDKKAQLVLCFADLADDFCEKGVT